MSKTKITTAGTTKSMAIIHFRVGETERLSVGAVLVAFVSAVEVWSVVCSVSGAGVIGVGFSSFVIGDESMHRSE